MIRLLIPTSIKDAKLLWKEKHDREYQKRRKAYFRLQRRIKALVERSQDLSGKEILETYESYFTPVFKEYYWDVMGVGKPKVKGGTDE